MKTIHPLACVDPRAELGEDVEIGPFCLVGPDVVIGDRCKLHPRVTLSGHTRIGRDNEFFPNTVIGATPQDLKYRGEPTRLTVGEHNTFREQVTVHLGTELGGGVTRIGDHNHLMVGCHVAHDSHLADHIILANNTLLAGHVHLEDCATIAGAAAVHHFVTVGRYAFVAGMARITRDVAPYLVTGGYHAVPRRVNDEGLRRWRFNDEEILALREAYRRLFVRRRTGEAMADIINEMLENGPLNEHVRYLLDFLRRSLMHGVHGRYREALREDRQADRGAFYNSTDKPDADDLAQLEDDWTPTREPSA
jgi:UDP-N-acetylglucosamine acyltransferase